VALTKYWILTYVTTANIHVRTVLLLQIVLLAILCMTWSFMKKIKPPHAKCCVPMECSWMLKQKVAQVRNFKILFYLDCSEGCSFCKGLD